MRLPALDGTGRRSCCPATTGVWTAPLVEEGAQSRRRKTSICVAVKAGVQCVERPLPAGGARGISNERELADGALQSVDGPRMCGLRRAVGEQSVGTSWWQLL